MKRFISLFAALCLCLLAISAFADPQVYKSYSPDGADMYFVKESYNGAYDLRLDGIAFHLTQAQYYLYDKETGPVYAKIILTMDDPNGGWDVTKGSLLVFPAEGLPDDLQEALDTCSEKFNQFVRYNLSMWGGELPDDKYITYHAADLIDTEIAGEPCVKAHFALVDESVSSSDETYLYLFRDKGYFICVGIYTVYNDDPEPDNLLVPALMWE